MTPEKERYLFDAYPIFDRNHERFSTGFNCEDGWFDLIGDLGEDLTKSYFKDLRVIGVKEKFGKIMIDVVYSDYDEALFINSILMRYGNKSTFICERCGALKKPTEDHCKPMNALRPRK